MKRINERNYKQLAYFCRKIFKERKFVSEREFNLLIQQQLNPCSTRYRRYMMSLELIALQNRLIVPGKNLKYFKLADYQAMNRLRKKGRVTITDYKIKFIPTDRKAVHDFPENWNLLSKERGILIFELKNNHE
ncbi:hypothetical protein [Chryseobacterium terrae]|uniref:Uncharacterized protein n=1 Tax=Chryseobacterium terrae TaxID=3163299 RepID=A0ABW8Y4B9_9FLAO